MLNSASTIAKPGPVGVGTAEILYVIGTLDVGGTERHLASVATALSNRGWSVSVYSLAGRGLLGDEMARSGVNVVVPPIEHVANRASWRRSVRLVVAMVHLFSVLVRRRPAIVHFFLPEAYLIGAPLAILACSRKRVMSRRSLNVYQNKHPAMALVERLLHRAMAAVLGNSRSVVDQLRLQEQVSMSRLGLIYNGVELGPYQTGAREATRRALSIADGMLVLVIVANLIPYKGHIDLMDALSIASSRLPGNWRLLIVGRDDGIGPAVTARAAALGIGSRISLLGQRNDVAAILQASDIGLLCSHEEGFSNAIIEGMAAGLPMIVTDVGGNSEAVVDGKTGLVVPSHDPQQLANAIARLAGDPALRARMSSAAQQRVGEHFSAERCLAAYEALYRELLAGGRPSSVAQIQVVD